MATPKNSFQLHVNDEIEPEDAAEEAPLPEGEDVYDFEEEEAEQPVSEA